MVNRRTRRRGLLGGLMAMAMVMAMLPASAGAEEAVQEDVAEPDAVSVVDLVIRDDVTLIAVVDAGFDLDHNLADTGDGYTVTGIVTNAEIAELEALGVGVDVAANSDELAAAGAAVQAERQAAATAEQMTALDLGIEQIDTVVIARADYFTSTNDSQFLSVEAKNIEGDGPTMTLAWDAGPGTDIGDGGSTNMGAFNDAGQYMYHRTQINLASAPPIITIDAPSSAAGDYSGVQASFGSSFPDGGVSGSISLVDDGSANPTEGCDPLVGFPAGAIALMDRGTCPFVQKVGSAQAAGASSVIVANNVAGAPFAMGGSDSSITIPSLMISIDDGATLKSGRPATGSITQPEPVEPTRISVTSSNGGYAEADVEEWLETDFPGRPHRYFEGFFNRYYDAHELTAHIEDLHARFPELTDIIEMPFLTNGYRRNAMHLSGGGTSQRVGLTSHAWGHEGGNDITIEYVDPEAADAALSVAVDGNDIVVSLATDAEGEPSSTAAEVVAAINANAAAAALVEAYTYRGNDGDGLVEAEDAAGLTDDLEAPASIPREPFQVKVLRIGKHRDGSKTGVLGYSQEHAREWQTPMVAVETASRLLENYATDHKTRQLVDNLDIFIVPVANPDGALYSHYDFASQRKSMTNHCEVGGSYDFNARNSWGVDNNRNYTAYSGFDGYSGSSTSCTSGTYRGPAELSEPESANMHWLPGAYPNIKFSMNIHSSGNYFMWSPGSYATPGRISAPRPSFGSETYFFQMADEILTEIKQHRGLSVTPARTGPIADVLYSAAGNSGDMMWYDFGIFGFSFEVGTSFQPSWGDGTGEAFDQMMEFSNGLVELLDVALTWTRDRYAPTSWINEDVSEPSDGPVGITFGFSEPVEIYYTLDGSNPTTDSAQYDFAGIREGGETIWITETTTVKWFAVDISGNVEGKYHPTRNNANEATIVIND